MSPIRLSILLFLLGLTAHLHAEDFVPLHEHSKPLPTQYLEKIHTTPDFCQGEHHFGEFDGHGEMICGPVALSNSLVWLDHHGFPKLLGTDNPTKADQANLIRLLCRPEFLATNQEGTTSKNLVLGIEKYFQSVGYACKVEQMNPQSSTHRIGKIPDENWMLRSCMGMSNVVIQVGWYKTESNVHRRFAGHFVTLVGFKEDHGKRVILIHDPSIRSGIEKKTEPCRLIPVPAHDTLILKNGETIKAVGFFKIDGIKIKKGADMGIIDGVIAFSPITKSE